MNAAPFTASRVNAIGRFDATIGPYDMCHTIVPRCEYTTDVWFLREDTAEMKFKR